MSNLTNKTTELLPDLARALIILPIMDKYMLIVLYIAGMIGSFLNIFTLLQKKFRKNPCSLYFLSASITDIFVMNGVLMIDALRYFNPALFFYLYTTTLWCKLGKYLTFTLSCLSSTFITLSCIDRFCTSSQYSQLRKLSQVKVSRILIPLVLLIWLLFASHILIVYDGMPYPKTNSDQCKIPANIYVFILIVDGYFFCIYNGIIVPIVLSVSGLLIYRNIQQSRRRTAPRTTTRSNRMNITAHNLNLNRQNLHLIIMTSVQSSLTVILNVPYMAIYLNSLYNSSPTNQLLLLVYLIFVYVARWFWFLNYVKTFYLNNLSSQMFRDTLKEKLISLSHQSRVRVLRWTTT